MQLTDAPEGKSSLQSRLNEAERRAQDAETSAQDARAALARTLLEAAQVEAVVMARIKAESEAELGTLRSELDAVKRAASTLESSLHETSLHVGVHAAPEEGAADDDLPAASARQPVASASQDVAEEPVAAATAAPVIQLRESDRPAGLSVEDEPEMESNILRFLPPVRLALLAFLAVGVIVGYLSAASFTGGGKSPALALYGAPDIIQPVGEGLVSGTPTDPQAIADASASLDAEMVRLEALSRKVAALRTILSERQGADSRTAPSIQARTAAAGMAAPADANWLLYMPVEKGALVQYLAGGSWPGMQIAAKR